MKMGPAHPTNENESRCFSRQCRADALQRDVRIWPDFIVRTEYYYFIISRRTLKLYFTACVWVWGAPRNHQDTPVHSSAQHQRGSGTQRPLCMQRFCIPCLQLALCVWTNWKRSKCFCAWQDARQLGYKDARCTPTSCQQTFQVTPLSWKLWQVAEVWVTTSTKADVRKN